MASTTSVRLDFNQTTTRRRQEKGSSILPADADSLSVVGMDSGGTTVFGPQAYPRPADDVLLVSVPLTVHKLLVTARFGTVDRTTFAAYPNLRIGTTVTVTSDQLTIVGVVIRSLVTSKLPALLGATNVTATVTAESPNGLALSYQWETTGGFTVTSAAPFGNAVTITAPAIYSADGTVKVTVRDSENATAAGSVALSTVAKEAPVINGITVSPQPVLTVADFVAAALDPLGGPLGYSWTVGGLPLSGNSGRAQWASPGIPGTYEVSLRATGVTGLYTDAATTFAVGSQNPWPQFRRDAQGTGLSPVSTATTTGTVAWTYQAGGGVNWTSAAVGADGTLYFGSYDKNLYALNPDGTLKWSYTTGGAVASSPAISADGTVYVGSEDSKVHAVRADGTSKWTYATGGAVYGLALGSDGTVYAGSWDKRVYALRPDGSLKWSYETGSFVPSAPAFGSDGTVYVGSDDFKMYALRPDGSLKWAYATGGYVPSSPAIGSDGTVYFGSHDKKVYALRPDGTVKWTLPVGDNVDSSPVIGADGTIYVGCWDKNVYAIRSDGTVKWTLATGGLIRCSAAIGAEEVVYVGSMDGSLYAIRSDGSLRWAYDTKSRIYASPTIGADATVYIGSEDGRLHAIR